MELLLCFSLTLEKKVIAWMTLTVDCYTKSNTNSITLDNHIILPSNS